MTSRLVYRASVYLTIVLASLILSVDRIGDDSLALFYPALVAVCGVLALLTVDRNPKLGLSTALANPLGLVAVGLAYMEYYNQPSDRLIDALGHLLIYLQLIKIFQVKRVEDDWYLLLLCLVEVVAGSYLGQSDVVGLLLVGWILASLWVLMLGNLIRESQRVRESPGSVASTVDAQGDPYAGLFDFAFFVQVARIAVITILLGGFIFLLMPRRPDIPGGGRFEAARHLSGFSQEVRLGQLGEILENDSVVMTIEGYDEDNTRVTIAEDGLWRGITLTRYSDRRWTRTPDDDMPKSADSLPISQEGLGSRPMIRYAIRLESNDSSVLFAPRPIVKARMIATSVGEGPQLQHSDGSLYRPDATRGAVEYEIWTVDGLGDQQPGERNLGSPASEVADWLKRYREIPRGKSSPSGNGGIAARLQQIAEAMLAEAGDPAGDLAKAVALEAALRDSGRFHYSLHQAVKDPQIDPIEDFLANTRAGHCEYFASALALLLRSIDIPTRVVNGFKGGEWNQLTRSLTVRQKHSHSWVEVLVRDQADGGPARWITLDPTPGLERDKAMEQSTRGSRPLRLFTDFLRQIWVFFVVGYNSERQQRWFYQPIQDFLLRARDGFSIMGEKAREIITWLFDFPDFSSLFSLRGFFVSVGVMLALVGLVKGLAILIRWVWRRLRGSGHDGLADFPGASFYRRAVQLLAEAGLTRSSTETPREFARRTGAILAARSADGAAVGEIPPEVVETYYALRFGGIDPAPEVLGHLGKQLDLLEAEIRRRNRN